MKIEIHGGHTDVGDGVAALNGASGARASGLASNLEGGGGRKKGQCSESEGSDAGKHVDVGELNWELELREG